MDRRIRSTKKDRNGNIIALCNPGQSWSPRSAKEVIRDINSGRMSYYVQEEAKRSYVRTVGGALQTKADPSNDNSLSRLPTT